MIEILFQKIAPVFLQDHLELTAFFGTLTYALFFINWIINTDWEAKLNYFSLATGLSGVFYLHYSKVHLLLDYELLFVVLWAILFTYHLLSWKSNYAQVMNTKGIKSLEKMKKSIVFRYLITIPTSKNALNHWNDPPFRNALHFVLIWLYLYLLSLHMIPFLPVIGSIPLECLAPGSISLMGDGRGISSNLLCCKYNYVIPSSSSSLSQQQKVLSKNFCSANVNIAFAGSWSTGKTYLINALLGHEYATAVSAPSPSTDKFTCIALGSEKDGYYNDPIRSDDYDIRKHCEIMSHVNGQVAKVCDSSGGSNQIKMGGGGTMKNVIDVAHVNDEFRGFVFFDMPGYQREYGKNCLYNNFYKQLIDQIDYTFIVWDVNHGKIEDEFGDFFHDKARGVNYEIIYNRYDENESDMGFLNQQYAKISGTGKEILNEMYTIKVHENSTALANNHNNMVKTFEKDISHLGTKIKGVNQTVHDNRKKLMKANLVQHQKNMHGILSLYKVKMSRELIDSDLNPHVRPKQGAFTTFLLSFLSR